MVNSNTNSGVRLFYDIGPQSMQINYPINEYSSFLESDTKNTKPYQNS